MIYPLSVFSKKKKDEGWVHLVSSVVNYCRILLSNKLLGFVIFNKLINQLILDGAIRHELAEHSLVCLLCSYILVLV